MSRRWSILGLVLLLVVSLALDTQAKAQTTLTDAQLITLGTAIRAEGSLADELTNNDLDGIRDYYNALASEAPTSAAFYIWKSSLTPAEYAGAAAMVPSEVAALTEGEARAWAWFTGNLQLTIDPSDTSFATWVAATFDGTTTETNLLALGQREATRGEQLFATGTGSQESPAVAAWEGTLTTKNIRQALKATE